MFNPEDLKGPTLSAFTPNVFITFDLDFELPTNLNEAAQPENWHAFLDRLTDGNENRKAFLPHWFRLLVGGHLSTVHVLLALAGSDEVTKNVFYHVVKRLVHVFRVYMCPANTLPAQKVNRLRRLGLRISILKPQNPASKSSLPPRVELEKMAPVHKHDGFSSPARHQRFW